MNNNVEKVLITGAGGLVGRSCVELFISRGYKVLGVDNDKRSYFFGKTASVKSNIDFLKKNKMYFHVNADILDSRVITKLFEDNNFLAIIHTAAQPSHDWAKKDPLLDFNINARCTVELLEAFRKYCPRSVFVYTSTNKVYGDKVNYLNFLEKDSRYEVGEENYYQGIKENFGIDNTMHSIFGVSKTSADLMVQEYGKYFNLNTVIFRCGCITGSTHSGVQLHGFLAYLAKCFKENIKYNIFGYKGKQVRDIIHTDDLARAIFYSVMRPRVSGVYNMERYEKSN